MLNHSARLCLETLRTWKSLALAVVAVSFAGAPVSGQDTVEFWWEGLHWVATTDEQEQTLGIIPNASATAMLALAEIGVPDFDYQGWYSPALGLFSRSNASGTPPIGGSTRDLITALSDVALPDLPFWSTYFQSGCSAFLPWPYVEIEVLPGTTNGQVYQLAQQGGGQIHGWLDDTHVLLSRPTGGAFELLDFANGLLSSPLVVTSEPAMSWTHCLCGCPSGDPSTGGGPTIPPGGAGPPSILEIPTLGGWGLILLALALALSGLRLPQIRE